MMPSKPKWKLVKDLQSGHGVNFIYGELGPIAYIDGYPPGWTARVTVRLLAGPDEILPASLDWEGVVAETKAAVTAYLAGGRGPHFVKGRVRVEFGG